MLNPEQEKTIRGLLGVGVGRATAAAVAGVAMPVLEKAISQRPEFAAELARIEALHETQHVRVINSAAHDKHDWRASLAWLERLAPERYGVRKPGVVTRAEMERMVRELCEAIAEEIRDVDDRGRVLVRVHELVTRLAENEVE